MQIKTSALVIREQKVADGDCVVTLLTGDKGVIRVWAKGIYSPKSKNSGARLFSYSDFTLFHSKERYTLNRADSNEIFFDLRKDISRLALCSYFAQLLFTLLDENDDSSLLLPLTLNCFHLAAEGTKDLRLIKACFELRLASIIGYEPTVDSCLCGMGTPSLFDCQEGAFFCESCRRESEHNALLIPVAPSVVRAMHHIISAPLSKVFSFSVGNDTLSSLSALTERFLLTQCGRTFSSLDFYKSI